MAIASNFPAIKPSLSLDFANTKRLDSRVTFTRTTTATYYDGVTTAMAEQNLLLYSQAFDNTTGWVPIRSSISANTTTAPDGTSTADSLIEDSTASNTHYVQPNSSAAGNFNSVVVNGSTYAFSVFAKANTRTQVCLAFYDGSSLHTAYFDLSGGTVLSSSGVTASIVNVGSGWYRCVGVRTNTTTTMALSIQLSVSGSVTYTGNGTSGIYIWGAQLEQRSSVTAYTATTTQPITNYIPVLLTAASGVARFDHNPTTDESLGLLIEEARTNLLLQSADFASINWVPTRASVTSNTVIAPNGTLTADKIVEDTTASNTHLLDQYSITVVSGTTYACSFYLKAAERNKARIVYVVSGSGVYADADLSAGTIGAATAFNTATAVSSSIQSVGNGWYRCTVVGSQSAGTNGTARIELLDASGNRIYTGNGYSGIYIWGAQLEAGAFPTSYIATTAATVTRNADAASMTGSNFTSWYNAAEGAIYCESQTASFAQNQGIWAIGNPSLSFGSGNMMYAIYDSGVSGRILINSYTNGSPQVSNMGVVVSQTANTFSKSAYVYKVNDFAQTTNAASVFTDTSGTVPIGPTGLSIGGLSQGWSGAIAPVNGTIKKLAYYPLRVTNAQLQALTS